MGNTILIPTDIAKQVLITKRSHLFATYLCLTSRCRGKIKACDLNLLDIAKQQNCSLRTIKNHLHQLLVINWIGYNPKSQVYFIRGWSTLRSLEKIEFKENAYAIFDFASLPYLREFLFAAYIQRISRYKRWKKRIETAHFMPSAKQSQTDYLPFSVRYLGLIFNLSNRTIFQLRRSCLKHNLLALHANIEKTEYDISHYGILIKYDRPDDSYYIVRDKIVYKRSSDLIKSNVQVVKSWKKSKQY